MAADIEELEQMIEATLSSLKGDDAGEEPRPIDLAALLETLASDAFDRGQEVSVSGPRSLTVFGRRIGIKRAFANIIQNALKYGDRARVSIFVLPEAIEVQIDDDGPGIPPDKLSKRVHLHPKHPLEVRIMIAGAATPKLARARATRVDVKK